MRDCHRHTSDAWGVGHREFIGVGHIDPRTNLDLATAM